MPRQKPRFHVLLIAAATFAAVAVAATAQAKPWWMRGTDNNENDFLPPDVAFRLGASLIDRGKVQLRWVIADGYYLYKQKIEVQAESPDLSVGAAQLPPGLMKTDPYLGRQEIYTQQIEVQVPYSRKDFGAHPMQLKVTYQGCAEAGLCYPPITKVLFPVAAPAGTATPPRISEGPHAWQLIAMIAGVLAFLLAGFVLRRGRHLAQPTQ